MGMFTSVAVDEVRSRGSIKDGDVQKLDAAFRESQSITQAEAEELIALDAACPVKDPTWAPFLVEAVTDYVVTQAQPEGYVTVTNSQWLTTQLVRHGRAGTNVAFDLMLAVLARARWSPTSLVVFALEQVKAGVVAGTGTGAARAGQLGDPGTVSEIEIDRLTRLLLAFGGDGGKPVTRAEADVLIDLNRGLKPGSSSPAWSELFVKAVGNAALTGLSLSVPDRGTALGCHAWLGGNDPAKTLATIGAAAMMRRGGGFAGRMVAGGAGSVWSSCRMLSAEELALKRLERQRREIITGEPIAEADEAWLVARLGAGSLDDNEMALLTFVEREAASLPKGIATLIARATIAA